MPQDFRRQEVEPGDRAVYVTTGRYAYRGIVKVLEVKTRVLVSWITHDRSSYGLEKPFWVDAASLFLITAFKGESLPAQEATSPTLPAPQV